MLTLLEGEPGEYAQFDHGEGWVEYVDGSRERIIFLACRLKYSRFMHVVLVDSQLWPRPFPWAPIAVGLVSLWLTHALAPPVLDLVAALALGLVWGALRVSSRSLAASLVAHTFWTTGVLRLWPLATAT